MSELHEWIHETAQGSCGQLLDRFITPLLQLDPRLQADIGSFGARFSVPQGVLCELSVFGELFIVRVGSQGSVEYRVRDAEVAMQALDHILQRYVSLQVAPRANPAAVVSSVSHT